ncbi:glutaredoxin [Candidatus Gracilibacteria bacterium]|nr:glutaredoxin [Candidatus Gracilibacteria bacterium]
MVKNLLVSLDIKYEEIDISKTPEIIMDLVKKSGMRTVPQVFFGETCLGGYDQVAKLHREGKLLEIIGNQ